MQAKYTLRHNKNKEASFIVTVLVSQKLKQRMSVELQTVRTMARRQPWNSPRSKWGFQAKTEEPALSPTPATGRIKKSSKKPFLARDMVTLFQSYLNI